MSTFWIAFLSAWFASGFTIWLASLLSGEFKQEGDSPRDCAIIMLVAFVVAMLIGGPGVLLVSVGTKLGAEKANKP